MKATTEAHDTGKLLSIREFAQFLHACRATWHLECS